MTIEQAAAGPVVTEQPATWTVRPGDTLSSIAAALAMPGGWQALYAANRNAIGPDPNVIRSETVLALHGTGKPTRYTVAAGDSLSAIATALVVPGGWQALYAANRQSIGADPNTLRPGTVLSAPRRVVSREAPQITSTPVRPRRHAPAAPPVSRRPSRPLRHAPSPAGSRASSHLTAPDVAARAGGMPPWLEDVLLAVGVLAATAFIAEPATVLARRRKTARSSAVSQERGSALRGANKAQIIRAEHERLVVTYSTRDHAVYLLTPPGEDPWIVLRAARLVLPEDVYKQLAEHLGIPAS